jgi:hypothetical protein
MGNAVWILDGATGLSKERLFATAPSDAAWFVGAVDLELRAADWRDETAVLISRAMRRVHKRFLDEALAPHERASVWPSASFALVRSTGGYVEFANLGDCRILWSGPDNLVKCFGSSRVTELDGMIVSEIRRLHLMGTTDQDAVWRAIILKIEANRKLRNAPGGYWILDVEGRGLVGLQATRVESSLIDKCLMCTDGFYRLVDTYRRHTDQSLLLETRNIGVGALIATVREIERRDQHGIEFPRIKSRDDATAVYMEVAPRP